MTPFFQVFDMLQLSEQLRIVLETAQILDITFHRRAQRFQLTLFFPQIVPSQDIALLETQMAEQLFQEQSVSVSVSPRFPRGVDARTILDNYYDNITWELRNRQQDIPLLLLFKGASICGDGQRLTLTTENPFLYDHKGTQLKTYLEKILAERFDLKTVISLQLASSEEQMELFRQYQQQKREDLCLQAAPVEISGSTTMIYGKNTDGAVRSIGDLEITEGSVLIQGRILSADCRPLKNTEKWMIVFAMTDDSDSVTVKLFLPSRQARELENQLQTGTCVKVRGVAMFDNFSQELCIGHVSGICLIDEFRPQRVDNALNKRIELHCHTKMSDSTIVHFNQHFAQQSTFSFLSSLFTFLRKSRVGNFREERRVKREKGREQKEKAAYATFSFWRRWRDLNPRTPCDA